CSHRDLHSFPTRRSSDLISCTVSPALLTADRAESIAPPTTSLVLSTAFPITSRVLSTALPTALRVASIALLIASCALPTVASRRSEEHTSELQSRFDLVC